MNDKTIQELREWEKKWPHSTLMGAKEFNKILTRAEEEAKEEPLAVKYRIAKGVDVVDRDPDRIRPDRENRWAVMVNGCCLNKDWEMEFETLPSSRTDAFLNRCRFTYSEALALARAYLAGLPDKEEK